MTADPSMSEPGHVRRDRILQLMFVSNDGAQSLDQVLQTMAELDLIAFGVIARWRDQQLHILVEFAVPQNRILTRLLRQVGRFSAVDAVRTAPPPSCRQGDYEAISAFGRQVSQKLAS